jgi:hypothetical protein
MKKQKRDFGGALPGTTGRLDAVLIHADKSHRDLGTLSDGHNYRLIGRPIQWWRSLWAAMRQARIIPITMGFAAFLAVYAVVDQPMKMLELFQNPQVAQIIMETGGPSARLALVVTGGANFLATDMASGQASPRISAMNYHDSGTGTTAATSTDSGLGTQAGPTTRATGVQSNPVTNQYRSVGTIAYVSGLAITEWGLFNQAAQGGTMWDRRVFGAINVISGDSIAYTYTLTVTAGGS